MTYSSSSAEPYQLWNLCLAEHPKSTVRSDNDVVHTLEAGIWSLLHSNSYQEAILTAVSFGGEANTTAMLTGGLAGIYYEFKAIPPNWIESIAKKYEIYQLFNSFVDGIPS